MVQFDVNINTALQGQADRVRAVSAIGSTQSTPASTPRRWFSSRPAQAAVALGVAAPIVMLMAWGVLAH